MAEVTDGDRERAEELIPHEAFCVLWLARGKQCQCKDRGVVVSFVAAALAEEREKARAPFLGGQTETAIREGLDAKLSGDTVDYWPDTEAWAADIAARIRRAAEESE